MSDSPSLPTRRKLYVVRRKLFGEQMKPVFGRGRMAGTFTTHEEAQRFFDELEDYMAEDAAEQTLRTIISWGRYAEVFAYDDHTQAFSLENPA